MPKEEDHDILIRLETFAKETRNDVKDIKTTIFGNGREGLCDVVKRHDERIKTLFNEQNQIKKGREEDQNRNLKIIGLMIAGFTLLMALIEIYLPL